MGTRYTRLRVLISASIRPYITDSVLLAALAVATSAATGRSASAWPGAPAAPSREWRCGRSGAPSTGRPGPGKVSAGDVRDGANLSAAAAKLRQPRSFSTHRGP